MKKTYIYTIKIIALLLLISITEVISQTDTVNQKLNMDAVYDRPFLKLDKLPLAIGGYLEANSQFSQTDGVNEGISFQARRLTLFFSSTIADRIKFLSEIEFEDGTKEINIEFAAVDIELFPLLNIRSGIVMNPIGAFNQNHDGPKWEFVDRPLSATTIIPSTLSNVGVGLFGKYYLSNWIFAYEAYLTNGFDDKIIDNEENRTSLVAGKKNIDKFDDNFGTLPTYSGKLAIRNRKIGELGISFLNGIYNKWQIDGVRVDNQRYLSILALDFNTTLYNRIDIIGEYSKLWINIPETYSKQYGNQQEGFYLDIIANIYKDKVLSWDNAKLNIGVRVEYVDYNIGEFIETNTEIGDEIWAIVPTISFRPVSTTVVRFNYRYQSQVDFLYNPASKSGVIQLGISSYF